MRPESARLWAALEATWPPVARRRQGAFTLRVGAGGGQRVTAATPEGPGAEGEIDAAVAAMREMGQEPIFQLRPEDAALDAALEARGWRKHDEVVMYLAPAARLAEGELKRTAAFALWPPLAIQREIWAEGHIGPDRLAVMERAPAPKTSILGRGAGRAAGTAYVGISDGIAALHALQVAGAHRRLGIARSMMCAAARWAASEGADWLALLVVAANGPANGLYASMGMEIVGQYHYRIPPEEETQ